MLEKVGIRLKKTVSNNSSKWHAVPLLPQVCKQNESAKIIEDNCSNPTAYNIILSANSESSAQESKTASDSVHGKENPQVSKQKTFDEIIECHEPSSSSGHYNQCEPYPSNNVGLSEQISKRTRTTSETSTSVVDDSDRDPDYLSSSDDSSSSSSTTGSSSTSAESEQLNPMPEQPDQKIKSRKRKAAPAEWMRNKAKLLRNTGQSYKMLNKNVIVPQRTMRPPCTMCRLKCSTKFTDEERSQIFKQYWSLADITKQRNYILQQMEVINPKYRYPKELPGVDGKLTRNNNCAFHLEMNQTRVRVCKTFFKATLSITDRTIRTVVSKAKDGFLSGDLRGKHDKHKQVPDEIKNGVHKHISSIPKIESHYLRAQSEKNYIEGGKTIAQLFRDYKDDCERNGQPHANLTMYTRIFNYEFNLSFFIPKKDQREQCAAYQNSNIEEQKELQEHLQEKDLSRHEKESDKKKISDLFVVACFDLQATLPAPRGDISVYYYKSKLNTYNFTVCDLLLKGQGNVECIGGNFNKSTSGQSFSFNDIAVLRVEKQHFNRLFYKTSYNQDSYNEVNIQQARTRKSFELCKNITLKNVYKGPIPISKKKRDGLMALLKKNHIPKWHAYFYNSLLFDATITD